MSADVTQGAIIAVIIGMGLINFTLRFVPLAVLSRIDLPRPLMRWLEYVPVSVMGALVATEVLRPKGQFVPPLTNPGFYAAILTALVFRFSRSFLGATLAGMASYVALRWLIG